MIPQKRQFAKNANKFIFYPSHATLNALHSVDKRSKPGSLVEIGFSSEKSDKMIGDPFRIVMLMIFTSRSFKLKFDFIFWYH